MVIVANSRRGTGQEVDGEDIVADSVFENEGNYSLFECREERGRGNL